MIPGEVLALLKDTPSAELPGLPAEVHACQGAKFHSPRPMIVHRFRVDGPSGERVIHLCGTCEDNVRLLMALLKARTDVPWRVRRCFGNQVRSVAEHTDELEEQHA